MIRRRARDQRRPGVRIVLGPRDEALLRGLSRFRIATTGQLVRLFFRGVRRDTAAPRLRRLYDAAMLDIVSAPRNGENVYAVGRAGRRWLDDRGLASGAVPHGSLAHPLEVVHAWTALASALHGGADVRLVRFVPDWEGRAESAGTLASVVPDATIDLAVRRARQRALPVRVFLEVDLATERAGVLGRKLTAYGLERAGEGVGLAVVLADAGERRVETVRRLAAEHWPSWSVVCRRSEWPDALLAHEVLAPLAASPDGEGSPADATPCGAAPGLSQGEGPSR